jgi:hypothetical protein
MKKAGTAITGVGGALGLLASLFDSFGWEEGAEAIGTIAGAFMGVGGAVSMLTTLFP